MNRDKSLPPFHVSFNGVHRSLTDSPAQIPSCTTRLSINMLKFIKGCYRACKVVAEFSRDVRTLYNEVSHAVVIFSAMTTGQFGTFLRFGSYPRLVKGKELDVSIALTDLDSKILNEKSELHSGTSALAGTESFSTALTSLASTTAESAYFSAGSSPVRLQSSRDCITDGTQSSAASSAPSTPGPATPARRTSILELPVLNEPAEMDEDEDEDELLTLRLMAMDKAAKLRNVNAFCSVQSDKQLRDRRFTKTAAGVEASRVRATAARDAGIMPFDVSPRW